VRDALHISFIIHTLFINSFFLLFVRRYIAQCIIGKLPRAQFYVWSKSHVFGNMKHGRTFFMCCCCCCCHYLVSWLNFSLSLDSWCMYLHSLTHSFETELMEIFVVVSKWKCVHVNVNLIMWWTFYTLDFPMIVTWLVKVAKLHWVCNILKNYYYCWQYD
jgi:hypothetical protein